MDDRLDKPIRDNIGQHMEIYSDAGSALIAVLNLHQPGPLRDDGLDPLYRLCRGHEFVEYPCDTVRAIARELGVDVG